MRWTDVTVVPSWRATCDRVSPCGDGGAGVDGPSFPMVPDDSPSVAVEVQNASAYGFPYGGSGRPRGRFRRRIAKHGTLGSSGNGSRGAGPQRRARGAAGRTRSDDESLAREDEKVQLRNRGAEDQAREGDPQS